MSSPGALDGEQIPQIDGVELGSGGGEARPSEGDVADERRYRLVSIKPVRTPEGCVGRDWFVYRIAQAGNDITGYRRGARAEVDAEVNAIVDALNGRRQWTKSKTDAKADRRAAAARRKSAAGAKTAATAESEDEP